MVWGAIGRGVAAVAIGLLVAGCGTTGARRGQCGGISVAEVRMVPARGLPEMVLTADGRLIEDPRTPFRLSPGVHKLEFVIDGKRHLFYGNFSPAGRFVIEIRRKPGESLTMELRPV